jgi:hypothetical protein
MVVPDEFVFEILENFRKTSEKPGFKTFVNINKESLIKQLSANYKQNQDQEEKEAAKKEMAMNYFLNYKFMLYFLKSEATLLQKFIASCLYLLLLLFPIYLCEKIIERSMKLLMYIIYILRPSKVFRMETLNILLASLLIVVNASLGIHLSSIAIVISIDFIKSFFIGTFVSLFVGFNLYETVTSPEITKEVFLILIMILVQQMFQIYYNYYKKFKTYLMIQQHHY